MAVCDARIVANLKLTRALARAESEEVYIGRMLLLLLLYARALLCCSIYSRDVKRADWHCCGIRIYRHFVRDRNGCIFFFAKDFFFFFFFF